MFQVRAFEDDIALRRLKQVKAIVIQAWARRIAAMEERKRLLKVNKVLYEQMIVKVIIMQTVVRMRLGRLEYKRRRKRWRSFPPLSRLSRLSRLSHASLASLTLL